jgi:starch synthase
LNILIACPEAVPYAKTGGLADVTGALIREFRKQRQDVSLVLPLYTGIRERFALVRTGKTVTVPIGPVAFKGALWATGKEKRPEAYFIECDTFFRRPELYGTAEGDYKDNALRYIFFSRAVLEACLALNIQPDVIHCNDWQTGLIPLYLRTLYRRYTQFRKAATLFTVHNLGYQGNFEAGIMAYTGLGWDFFVPERIEFYGKVSFLKAGLLYADLLNTVSPTYAREILSPEYGFRLDGVLRRRQDDLYGIINGIADTEWDPSLDPLLPSGFSLNSLRGKRACKAFYCDTAGFTDSKPPLLGVVSRLSGQKGLDLLLSAVDELVRLGVNIAVLGKGEEQYHTAFLKKAKQHAGRVQATVGFEDELAHRIYAAADFFLMPSRYEPCGIGQLIAMRYGSVPIARMTGGLADTIDDYDHLEGKGSGFLFRDYTSTALLDAVKRALCVYTDARNMKALIRAVMAQDFSWKASAQKYRELYRKGARKVSP